jgi:hypothetical protein
MLIWYWSYFQLLRIYGSLKMCKQEMPILWNLIHGNISLCMMECFHILVKLQFIWISIMVIGELVMLIQYLGCQDHRPNAIWFPFIGPYAGDGRQDKSTNESGILVSNNECCCLYTGASWNDATGSELCTLKTMADILNNWLKQLKL